MAAVSKVLVVGGGIGGLTAAVALRRQGIAIDLIEIKPDLSVYGVGIIQPNNTLRALSQIGLAFMTSRDTSFSMRPQPIAQRPACHR
jgi:2-polyprenyl-6-methoxyphenol hydroxylase-like FAD-dependent oxidoreductase